MNSTGSVAGPRLSYRNVGVEFGPVVAVDDFTLDLAPGEIVGLLGHNGAGKSTILNVSTGAAKATRGAMLLDGLPLPQSATPSAIAKAGITVVHQEPALAGNLSILDNLFLARRAPRAARGRASLARDALARVGADHLDLSTFVNDLSLGERQLVDLARGAIGGHIKVLMLDEPTAALGDRETRALHVLIRRLAAEGTTVVYVSHRLPDIIEVCSRIVVMKSGAIMMDKPTGDLTPATLAEALAPGSGAVDRNPHGTGEVVLEVDSTPGLVVHRGEIVGLYGMAAGEQFEVLEALAGSRGEVQAWLGGAPYSPRTPREAIRSGVHLVPADRDHEGLIAGMSAFDNVFIPWGQLSASQRRRRPELYARMREDFVVQGPDGRISPIETFSGGNRQKHLLGSWMSVERPRVLLLAQPTQGVDAGAKVDIARAVRHLASQGTAVLVASAETDEIGLLCDRSYVFAPGRAPTSLARSAEFESDLLASLLAPSR